MKNSDNKNPAERDENAHLDFRKADRIYFAEHLGTILDNDMSLGYLKYWYRVKTPKPHVTLWELDPITGFKHELAL